MTLFFCYMKMEWAYWFNLCKIFISFLWMPTRQKQKPQRIRRCVYRMYKPPKSIVKGSIWCRERKKESWRDEYWKWTLTKIHREYKWNSNLSFQAWTWRRKRLCKEVMCVFVVFEAMLTGLRISSKRTNFNPWYNHQLFVVVEVPAWKESFHWFSTLTCISSSSSSSSTSKERDRTQAFKLRL